jgi:GDP-4-dehydro-6-deoxy-D-mannose reductase
MRAVITGAGGFVGHHLASHLREAGDEVVALEHHIDVTDLGAVARALGTAVPQAVYHLAALSHVGSSFDDPGEVVRVNVLGTCNVLTAARRAAPDARVLVVSSADVYGVAAEEDLPLVEDARLHPGSPYAASKAAAELLGLQAFLGFGQDVVVARPFNHIGPGQHPSFFVPAVARRLVDARVTHSRKVQVGNLAARRDFTDVRDVVRAYRLLVERGEAGEVYNVCTGRDVPIREVADRLRTLLYEDAEFVEDPSLSRPIDLPVLRGDPAKLREATGWVPTWTLEETLAAVAAEAQADAA